MIANFIFGSNIFSLIFYLLNILLFSYGLGSIVQSHFDYKKNNKFISLPLGFVVFQVSTFFFYIIPIAFKLNVFWYRTFETIKEFVILFLLVYFYKLWWPTFKNDVTNINSILLFYLSISLSIGVYLVFSTFVFHQNTEDMVETKGTFLYALNQMYIGNEHFYFTNELDNKIRILQKYETTYYWIWILTNLFSFPTADSRIIDGNTINIIKYVSPLMAIIFTTNVVWSPTLVTNKNYNSIFISTIISVLATIFLAWVGPYSETFYTMPPLFFMIFILHDYTHQELPIDKSIILILFIASSLVTVSYLSLVIFIMMGAISVIASIEKKGQSTRNGLIYFIFLFSILLSFSIVYFLLEKSLTGTIVNGTLLFLTLFVFILPLHSLVNISKRRNELIVFEQNTRNKILLKSTFVFLTLLLISLLLLLMNNKFVIEISLFFSVHNLKWYFGLAIYILFLLIPTIIIYVVKLFNPDYSQMINSFMYLNLIFNPISISMISLLIIGKNVNLLILILPSVAILFIWLVGILLKKINKIKRL